MIASNHNNPSVYTDFQDLTKLRHEAGQNSEQALEKAARQFEGLFVQMMLKSMREAGQGEGLLDNDQSNLYRDMYDKQLSLHLTEQGEGLGLAKMMIQQLKSQMASQADDKPSLPGEFAAPARSNITFERTPAPTPVAPIVAPEATATKAVTESLNFESPEQFVKALTPIAERIAQRMGVDPKALIAQAALETGWGKSIIQHPDGASSHNLFNIKADSRWDGERVAKQTLEYRQGIAAKEMAQFRSYDSLSHSFEDYADFLTTSPRYSEALKQGSDAERYVERLQEAGYATDPAYAEKIKRIMGSDTLASVGSSKRFG